MRQRRPNRLDTQTEQTKYFFDRSLSVGLDLIRLDETPVRKVATDRTGCPVENQVVSVFEQESDHRFDHCEAPLELMNSVGQVHFRMLDPSYRARSSKGKTVFVV